MNQNPISSLSAFIGYQEKRLAFNEPARTDDQAGGSQNFGNIMLESIATELDGVTITAQKPFLQREQDKLIVNVEGSLVSTGNSTLEVLEKSPGIIIDPDGNIAMNGKTGVRVFIDHKDTRLGGEQLANILRSMPSSNIEKIELITNPSAKYRAEGNAGIINILTKKGKFYGTNGSLTLSPGHGRYFRWENSLNFNHRTNNFNLYGQYAFAKRNQYQEILIDREFFMNGRTLTAFKLRNDLELPIESHTPRLGLDYTPNDRTSFGVLLSGLANKNGNQANTLIRQFSPENVILTEEQTDIDINSKWFQLTGNFNARHQFKNKAVIDFDFDAARYNNTSTQLFDSDFYGDVNNLLGENRLTGDVDGFLNLVGLSLDYEVPISEKQKVEIGWKSTWVTTDNDLQYFNEVDGSVTLNEGLSNHFIYDETIYAGYVNYSFRQQKWNAQFGLRTENTLIKGNQLTTATRFENDYLGLFPSGAFNYNFTPNHIVGVSFSRRIDRPSYNQLNPFRTFVNTNTFREGNPFLLPQFTWSTELNFTLKQRYYFAFNYSFSKDNLNRAILQDGENQAVVVKNINVDQLQTYALTASLPIDFAKWWNSRWNLNSYLLQFDSDIEGFLFQRNNPILSINTSHTFSLKNNWRIQLNAFYLPPHYMSITKIQTLSQVSIGIQKTILKGKGNIRLQANDIFWTGWPEGVTDFGNINDHYISMRDTRFATFSFTWQFGKQSIRPAKRRRTGVESELNRARMEG